MIERAIRTWEEGFKIFEYNSLSKFFTNSLTAPLNVRWNILYMLIKSNVRRTKLGHVRCMPKVVNFFVLIFVIIIKSLKRYFRNVFLNNVFLYISKVELHFVSINNHAWRKKYIILLSLLLKLLILLPEILLSAFLISFWYQGDIQQNQHQICNPSYTKRVNRQSTSSQHLVSKWFYVPVENNTWERQRQQ